MSGLRRCAVEVNFVSKLKKGSIQVSFYEYFLFSCKINFVFGAFQFEGADYNILFIYPQVNGKKSYFSVLICSAPCASYHRRNFTFSSTIPIFICEHPIFPASAKACPKSCSPIFLCLYSSNTHKLFSSHSS